MRFVEWFLANLSEVLSDDFVLFRSVLELDKLFSLTDQLNDIFQLHILIYFLDVSRQCLHIDVIVAADDTQIRALEGIFFLISLKTFYMRQILSSFVNEVGEIQTHALFIGLVHVIEIWVVYQSAVHEGPSEPVYAFAFVGDALGDDCGIEVVMEVDMQG